MHPAPPGKVKTLFQRPRVEMIPALLNMPLVAVLLYLLLANPDLWPLINQEGAMIFGASNDYVALLLGLATVVGTYSIAYVLLVIVKLKHAHRPVLNVAPIVMSAIMTVLFVVVLAENDIVDLGEIFTSLGLELGLAVYLVVISLAILLGIMLVHGLPILWTMGDPSRRHLRPRFVAVTTLVGYMLGISFPLFFAMQHPSTIVWEFVFYKSTWYDPVLVVSTVALVVLGSSIGFTTHDGKQGRRSILAKRHVRILQLASLATLLVALVLLGMQKGCGLLVFHPVFLVTLVLLTFLLSPKIEQRWIGHIMKNKGSNGLDARKKDEVARVMLSLLIVLPAGWIAFYQPTLQLPPRPPLAPVDVHPVQNSYANLTATQRLLFDEYLNDGCPPGSNASDWLSSGSGTRNAVRLASGLLFRNGPGDAGNATDILEWLLPLQDTNPASDFYGVWKTAPNSVTHDSNWREFIGCELILIIERHEDKIAPGLVARIEAALVRAAEGAMSRNVNPTYTNIAVMSAFLMHYVGVVLGRPALEDSGLLKAWQIFLLYERGGTFSEFNSPTYDGVTMMGVAFWRALGQTQELRTMGASLERSFWEGLSWTYHAGLKNMVGPYYRSYGMDLHVYNAIVAMWMALAVDELGVVPLPRKTGGSFFELSNIFPAVQLGYAVPDGVVARLRAFPGPAYSRRIVPREMNRLVTPAEITAMLAETWMMGGVSGHYTSSGQFKAGILHWNNSIDGSISWLMVPSHDVHAVKVTPTSMEVSNRHGLSNVTFFLNAPGLNASLFTGTSWHLPGITLGVDLAPSLVHAAEIGHDSFKATYYTREGLYTLIRVTCTAPRIVLTPS
ncbi:MAG: hypothetical protein JW839_09875 [Candidatus Lokiarchaeota archaeon]|nr:hypothetical protein [Candidatus Lokiarchaeota archaeon]